MCVYIYLCVFWFYHFFVTWLSWIRTATPLLEIIRNYFFFFSSSCSQLIEPYLKFLYTNEIIEKVIFIFCTTFMHSPPIYFVRHPFCICAIFCVSLCRPNKNNIILYKYLVTYHQIFAKFNFLSFCISWTTLKSMHQMKLIVEY